MGIPVMIFGESGTGKSTSLRNFSADEISLINVDGKPLPFRGKFAKVVRTDNPGQIIQLLKSTKSKIIVVDDFQYVMGNEFMRRGAERGFDKFTEIGMGTFGIVETVKQLPEDTIVYFLAHSEVKDGITTIKTIGKVLDEKVSLIGKYTIALKTVVQDGQYLFSVHNNGADAVKSPLGMFEEDLIPNDLKLVDNVIRDYYGLGEIN